MNKKAEMSVVIKILIWIAFIVLGLSVIYGITRLFGAI